MFETISLSWSQRSDMILQNSCCSTVTDSIRPASLTTTLTDSVSSMPRYERAAASKAASSRCAWSSNRLCGSVNRSSVIGRSSSGLARTHDEQEHDQGQNDDAAPGE